MTSAQLVRRITKLHEGEGSVVGRDTVELEHPYRGIARGAIGRRHDDLAAAQVGEPYVAVQVGAGEHEQRLQLDLADAVDASVDMGAGVLRLEADIDPTCGIGV